jgi:hypothetical protein
LVLQSVQESLAARQLFLMRASAKPLAALVRLSARLYHLRL